MPLTCISEASTWQLSMLCPQVAVDLQVDLKDGSGLAECLEAMQPLAAIINTAAITSPAICEKYPEKARCGLQS